VSHETIYRSLLVQARGVLKKELLCHLRSKRTIRPSKQAGLCCVDRLSRQPITDIGCTWLGSGGSGSDDLSYQRRPARDGSGSREVSSGYAGLNARTRAARVARPSAVVIGRMDVGVRSAQQHQEERSVGVVSGKGSAAFRALHDNLPFGCTNAPSPRAATFFQQYFKDRQLMRHCSP
jgi:hypothetical protein